MRDRHEEEQGSQEPSISRETGYRLVFASVCREIPAPPHLRLPVGRVRPDHPFVGKAAGTTAGELVLAERPGMAAAMAGNLEHLD